MRVLIHAAIAIAALLAIHNAPAPTCHAHAGAAFHCHD
jgi:hypothetical protein